MIRTHFGKVVAGSEELKVSEHLTQAQIERYVARSAPVDEILAIGQHLDQCFACRDRAAAIVDPGTNELSHVRHPRGGAPAAPAQTRRAARLLPWILLAIGIVAAVIAWLMRIG